MNGGEGADRRAPRMRDLPEPVIPDGIPAERVPSLLSNWFLGSRARRWLSRRRFAAVTGTLPPGDGERALDVGCGWGYNLFLLERRGYRPCGIDIVQDDFTAARLIARANGAEALLAGADMSALPFDCGTFAALTAVETFEHIYYPDRGAALAEALRVLRPGGRLVLSTPNHASFVEAGKRLVQALPLLKRIMPPMCYPVGDVARESYHPHTYHRPAPEREISGLLRAAGFRVESSQRIIFVVKNLPDRLFPAARGCEALLERLPLLRRTAETLVISAVKPG